MSSVVTGNLRSHSGSQRFAIDFGVPTGTEVRAARGGVVIGAEAHLHFHVSTPLQARDDRKFEAYRTFPTVFKTADGAVELLDPNRSYLVP